MLDLELSKLDAIDFARKTYIITELTSQAKEDYEFDPEKQIWEVKTEYFHPDGNIRPINLFFYLQDDFPLVIPEILADKQFLIDVGYLPHINSRGVVCLYDATSITLDVNRPGEILTSAIHRAITIIEDGMSGKNIEDFADEFVAYWSDQYTTNDAHYKGLCMVGSDDPDLYSLKTIVLDKKFKDFRVIVHDECSDFKILNSYFREYKHSFVEYPTFYLGTSSIIYPPFNLTNGEILLFIEKEFKTRLHEFGKFLEQNPYSTFLIFSIKIGSSLSFFGWYLPFINCSRSGFRSGTLKPLKVLASFQKNETPPRLVLETYTSNRLQTRTTGTIASKRYSFTVAGLGSIGSNLIPYLVSLECAHFSLIDFDVLTIENINRHLLGMSYVGVNKAQSMKIHLQLDNPLLTVESYNASVIEVLNQKSDVLNNSDFIIVAIGINSVEEYIANALADGKITKPVLFFWVEPYLMGGHCIFLTPLHSLSFKNLFENGLYNYNIISKETYKNPAIQIKLREAGCQTSYIPYGRKSMTRFLSSIITTIYKIIEGSDVQNIAISWRNSKNVIDGLDIKLSEFGESLDEYQTYINML